MIRKIFIVLFLKYKRLKQKLRVFLAGHSVAKITYCVTKNTNAFTSDWAVFNKQAPREPERTFKQHHTRKDY